MNLSWLLPYGKGIPVLMYHRVWPGIEDALTISPQRLREQWEYLKKEGYHTLSLAEYLAIASGKITAPAKAVLLTFDDGYRNNLQFVYPLLRELGWSATFFIIGNTLDGAITPETDVASQKLSLSELQSLDASVVQIAMHGYAHKDFGRISGREMEEEIQKAVEAFDNSGLPYYKIWAYAYGSRPPDMRLLKKTLLNAGITGAFRIGNKISKTPAENIYEMKRIDIKGTDSIEEFKIKLRKGKLRPF